MRHPLQIGMDTQVEMQVRRLFEHEGDSLVLGIEEPSLHEIITQRHNLILRGVEDGHIALSGVKALGEESVLLFLGVDLRIANEDAMPAFLVILRSQAYLLLIRERRRRPKAFNHPTEEGDVQWQFTFETDLLIRFHPTPNALERDKSDALMLGDIIKETIFKETSVIDQHLVRLQF